MISVGDHPCRNHAVRWWSLQVKTLALQASQVKAQFGPRRAVWSTARSASPAGPWIHGAAWRQFHGSSPLWHNLSSSISLLSEPSESQKKFSSAISLLSEPSKFLFGNLLKTKQNKTKPTTRSLASKSVTFSKHSDRRACFIQREVFTLPREVFALALWASKCSRKCRHFGGSAGPGSRHVALRSDLMNEETNGDFAVLHPVGHFRSGPQR